MNRILLAILLVGTQFAKAQSPCIVNIPDADFKTTLLNHNPVIDTNEDGEIQCDEAANYSSYLDLQFIPISDLTGLESFTSITSLYLRANAITSIDLSANIALTHFSCEYNNISSLDLSTNTELIDLFVENCQLTSLDLSNNNQLLTVSCMNNKLSELILGSTIVYLNCSNNQITSINTLNAISLEQFYCGINALTSLDLSQNTNLMYLNCANNFISHLDLSNNPSLLGLYCNNNQLTSVNVANGNNANLHHLQIQNSPNLTCIQVDDVAYSNANWTYNHIKPETVSWSENCFESLSLNEVNEVNPVSAFPNPTTGITYLSEIGNVHVFDTSGRLVLEQNNTNSIDLSNQESGIYLVKVHSKNGLGTARIIKK